ncbi:hypothetical protein AC578_2434 [Pseudocercospora eumusae]|uniref:Uncharacterized protein n=1 Tax=Pseudocercospora eumusae TaxID=321146 RepID=A0A139HXS7_9PEZI|nr:hypothetical protein AC578_2434 [Pseudocercospora eumusae]
MMSSSKTSSGAIDNVQLTAHAHRDLRALVDCADANKNHQDELLEVHFDGTDIRIIDIAVQSAVVFNIRAEPSDGTSKGSSRTSAGGIRSSAQGGKTTRSGSGKGQGGGKGSGRGNGDPPTVGKILQSPNKTNFDLPDMALGARELCCYFPHQSQWADYMIRLVRNGWKPKDIAKAQLFHRGELNKVNLTRRHNALRHQIIVAGRDRYSDDNWTPTRWQETAHADSQPYNAAPPNGNFIDLYDVTNWRPPRGQSTGGHVTFEQIRQGVDIARQPTGEDAGVFTRTVQWVFANHSAAWRRAHRIDEVPSIAAAQNILPTNEAQNTATWDRMAVDRLQNNVPDPTS